MMDRDFVDEITRNLSRAGYSDRSRFIRDAVFEKLQKLGVKVTYEKALAPTRARVIQLHNGTGHNYSLNETSPKYKAKKRKKP